MTSKRSCVAPNSRRVRRASRTTSSGCSEAVTDGRTPDLHARRPLRQQLLSSFGVSSEARSHSTLQAARRDFTHSTDRKDRIRHEAEQVRDHVQEDYGLRVPKLKD